MEKDQASHRRLLQGLTVQQLEVVPMNLRGVVAEKKEYQDGEKVDTHRRHILDRDTMFFLLRVHGSVYSSGPKERFSAREHLFSIPFGNVLNILRALGRGKTSLGAGANSGW